MQYFLGLQQLNYYETHLLRKPDSRSPLVLQLLRNDNGRPVGLYQNEGIGSAAAGAQPRMHPCPAMDGDDDAHRAAVAGGCIGMGCECMVAAGCSIGVLLMVRGGVLDTSLYFARRE